ncbi:MAG: toll/interleukin-1 receptor domain-containing protein [Ruminococcaceae bacterium]|nr:toll/interleukin-1 receptor domain-containing protein [Oscillospiraceae bacterium]
MSEQYKTYEGNEPYIFVSYAHKDIDIVVPIIRVLQEHGFRVWYDAGIEAGTEWAVYISTHLKASACMICFMTPNAAESLNCRNEITLALNKNIQTLCVYLEDFELPDGLDLQLVNFHALYQYRHRNQESFIRELLKAKILQMCRRDSSSVPQADTIQKPEPLPKTEPAPAIETQQDIDLESIRKAAGRGEAQGMYLLGLAYLNGTGVNKNEVLGASWFLKAANLKHIDAMRQLVNCYRHGIGVTKSTSNAAYWGQVIAQQQNNPSSPPSTKQTTVGSAEQKQPVSSSAAAAENHSDADQITASHLESIRKAAGRGEAQGMYLLGLAYLNGTGVDKNEVLGTSWLLKAANLKHVPAMKKLAYCYRLGIGVTRSTNSASIWEKLAQETSSRT